MRKTINNEITFKGIGIHTGKRAKIIIKPNDKEGIFFKKNNVKIPASIKYSKLSKRGTVLQKGDISIHTVEHLLSALYGAGIDDCIIEVVKGSEIPIIDGSCKPFFDKIKKYKVEKKNTQKDYLRINNTVIYEKDDVFIKATPNSKFKISYLFDGTKFNIQSQKENIIVNRNNYNKYIKKARTFGFWSEIKKLKDKGLALGGSLENALIIKDGSPYKTDYRVDKELVLHKIADFIGDMYLSQKDIKGEFVVKRSGHYHNNLFLKKLIKELK